MVEQRIDKHGNSKLGPSSTSTFSIMGSYMSSLPPKTKWSILHAEVIKLGEDFEIELELDDEEGYEENDDAMSRCVKNSGHKNMTPVSEFTLDDIPDKWKSREVFYYIVMQARRVVKLSVSYVSADRPDNYPLCDQRGQSLPTVGSGDAVLSEGNQPPPIKCPLPNCPVPGEHKTTAPFLVNTARHVVFDDSEAVKTKVEFFYDSGDLSNIVEAQVLRVDGTRITGDNTILSCVSHDLDLPEKLDADLPRIDSHKTLPHSDKPKRPLVVVMGHPHGSHKHLSFGNLVRYDSKPDDGKKNSNDDDVKEFIESLKKEHPNYETEGVRKGTTYMSPEMITTLSNHVENNGDDEKNKSLNSITYTAATCPGTSGGSVNVFMESPPGKVVTAITANHFKHRYGKRNASGSTTIEHRHTGDCLKNVKEDAPVPKKKPHQPQ